MQALYIVVPALGIMAIAYRYYSAFIAAKVMSLDDSRVTPAHSKYDGHNYYPTIRWVHHRARPARRADALHSNFDAPISGLPLKSAHRHRTSRIRRGTRVALSDPCRFRDGLPSPSSS